MIVSEIMEFSAEMAEFKVTQKLGSRAWLPCENGDEIFTEEAQNIFNEHYDIILNMLINYIDLSSTSKPNQ